MTLSISAVLTNNNGAGNETVAAGGLTDVEKTSETDGSALVALGIYIQCIYHAAATAGAQALVFGSPDGIRYGSTNGLQTVDIPFSAGATRSVAFSVLPGHKYYKVLVKNLDPVQDLTFVSVFAEPQVLS